MYLGSDVVARDWSMLQKLGITHVVNAAADYSENYHLSKRVQYKSYRLKDHVREDISCVFYDVIPFIQDARNQGGKVYVHCVQGISRSATLVLAYKIFTEKITYQQAYDELKQKRMCINPNMTFIA